MAHPAARPQSSDNFLVSSRLLLNAGNLGAISAKSSDAISHVRARAWRMEQPTLDAGKQAAGRRTDAQVWSVAGQLATVDVLRALRLKYCARLAVSGPALCCAAIQATAPQPLSWAASLRGDPRDSCASARACFLSLFGCRPVWPGYRSAGLAGLRPRPPQRLGLHGWGSVPPSCTPRRRPPTAS